MSSQEKRLDLAYALLGVKPRALLMLRDFKTDKKQNYDLVRMAPERQTKQLNRLIGLMNAANGDVAHLIVILHERAEKEFLRFSWLEWARLCAMETWLFREYFARSASEPITESDYRVKEEAARNEMLPDEDCANIITEESHAFDDADFETTEDGFRSPTDEAWYRVRDEKVVELKQLAAAGTLVSSGRGKGLKIQRGSLYDWLRQPLPVVPEYGLRYEVLPDHRKADVERMRDDHAFVRKLLDRGACHFDLPLDIAPPFVRDTPPGGFSVEMARVLAAAIKTNVENDWQELTALEEQVASMIDEFDGEDVLHPRVRRHLDEAKATFLDLHEKVQTYTGPFELPEPDEDVRDKVQHIVDQEASHVRTR